MSRNTQDSISSVSYTHLQTTGCIAMFVLAFLVSPFGLPALGGWLVERLYGVKYAAMDFMAS